MIKLEALAKDCIENHTHRLIDRPSKQDIYTREESIYISGYKECERQNKNKIAELERKLEQTEKDLTDYQFNYPKIKDLEKENDVLKEGLAVGSMWNKHLNFLNKKLEEDRDKYRNMVFDKDEQLTKAKELLNEFMRISKASDEDFEHDYSELIGEAEQFLSEVKK